MDTDSGRIGKADRAGHEPSRFPSRPSGDHPLRVEDAIAFAAAAHAGQVDKAGKPYILHPLRVMLRMEGVERQVVGVLHDVVEDCGVSLDEISVRFGEPVAAALDALSRREGESYDDFIERCGANDLARSVKWADIRDNSDLSRLDKITGADLQRVEKYRKASNRLTAIAMETQSAMTEGHGPKDDSAGLQASPNA